MEENKRNRESGEIEEMEVLSHTKKLKTAESKMDTIEELTGTFHSLDGATIQEKRKSFNSFIKSLYSTTDEIITCFVRSVIPKNKIEEIFKIDLMIYFKRHNLLIEELKNNNSMLVGKLLKNWKLFGDIFSNINPQHFVEDILPCLSYSLRLKLLNGIYKNVKNEKLLDEYFTALENKYSLKIAAHLLPGCTINLIRDTVKRLNLKLSTRNLIIIFKKDREFVDFYFSILKERNPNVYLDDYKNSLKYIAKLDPDMYWQLNKKYNFRIKFGKHTTTRMFRSNSDALTDGFKFIRCFHRHQLYKTARIDGSLNKFLLSMYPKDHDDFSYQCLDSVVYNFIQLLPQSQQYTTIHSLFKEKYGKNLLDYPQYCEENLLKIMPLKEREDILNVLVKNDDQLLYLYEPSKSIDMIKDRLRHCADVQSRSKLIISMYKTCAFFEDEKALLKVLHYVLNRHKNDIKVLSTFYNYLMHWPDLISKDESYWSYITDIAKILKISKPGFDADSFYIKHICHLITYNKPCKEQIVEFIKQKFEYYYGHFSFFEDKKYEKRYIEKLGECIPLLKGHEHYQLICLNFLVFVTEYNSENTKTQIPLNNYSDFFDQLKSEDCYNSETIIKFGLKNYKDDFWHDLFWKHSKTIVDSKTLLWYLQNRQDKITEHIDRILECLNIRGIHMFIKRAAKVLDNDTLGKIKTHVLKSLLSSEDYKEIKSLIKMISVLAPQSLSDIIVPLLPKPDIHINYKESKNKLLLHKILIKRIHKLGEPQQISPLVFKFCTKKYSKYVLPPLCCITDNMPEIRVKGILKDLFGNATFMRKYIISFARRLLAFEDFIQFLQEYSEIETNAAIKRNILKRSLQYLTENPTDFLWTSIKKNIKLVDKSDKKMYDLLLKSENVPHKYLPDYFQIIYEEILSKSDYGTEQTKFQLLSSIKPEIIDQLDVEFLKQVIIDTACLENAPNFHWKCVFETAAEKREELFKQNFEVFANFVEQNRPDFLKRPKVRSVISKFLDRFLAIVLGLKQVADLLEKFVFSWTTLLEPNSFCSQYIKLYLVDSYFRSNFDAYQTGIKINELLYNYVEKCNSSILVIFSRHLKKFLYETPIREDKEMIKFIEGLFYNRHDENIYIIVMNLLSFLDGDCPEYISTLKVIKECEIPAVKLHYDLFLDMNAY